jgi:hypothetical protein
MASPDPPSGPGAKVLDQVCGLWIVHNRYVGVNIEPSRIQPVDFKVMIQHGHPVILTLKPCNALCIALVTSKKVWSPSITSQRVSMPSSLNSGTF